MLPKPKLQLASRRTRFLWAASLILLFSFWLRAANLYGIPIFSFADEADHIVWAQRFAVGNTVYPFLMDGKFLLGVWLAMFQPNGPAALWIARCAIALFATLSCGASITLGARLHSPRAGLMAGLIYAILPQALLFEKQVFADPLMAAFGILAAALSFRLVHRPNRFMVAATAIALVLAALTKFNGLTYLAFPALTIVLFTPSQPSRLRVVRAAMFTIVTALFLMGAVLLVLSPRLGQYNGNLAAGRIGFIGCPALMCESSWAQQFHDLMEYASNELEALIVYMGWPVILLALAAVPFMYQRRRAGYFGLATLVMWLAFAFTAKGYVPARYMSFIAAPFAIFAALGMLAVGERLATLRPPLGSLFAIAAIFALAAQPVRNTIAIVGNFNAILLASQDYPSYFAPGLGPGIRDAAVSLQPIAQQNPPPVILVGDIYEHLVGAYFDRTRVDVRGFGTAHAIDFGRWLTEGRPIFIFDQMVNVPSSIMVERFGNFPSGESTVGVWRVIGVDPITRNQIFHSVFIEPDKLTAEYNILVNALPESDSLVLLVYPPNQAQTLAPLVAATRPNVSAVPIGDSWPLDVSAAEAELQVLAAAHSNIQVVFVEEIKGDPQRRLETWLKTHLFIADEQWFGPVRMLSFAGNGSVGQLTMAEARFGGGVTLEKVEVLDPVPLPGSFVRVRLMWQVQSPISTPHKIFTHLFSGDSIIAQHDGQPVGELRPTDTWQTGEQIVDQFAIRLPANAPSGVYQLRIGMYDMSTQVRLPMLMPNGVTGEFFIGGSLTVK